jgi:hypothetical protein
MPKREEPAFARQIREEFTLPPEADAILQEAIRAYERLEQIREELDESDLVIEGRANSRVANPLIAAERAARSSFVQILRALNLGTN